MAIIRKYIYNLTEYFMVYISNKNIINNNKPSPIKRKKGPKVSKKRNDNKKKDKRNDTIENNSKSLRTFKSEGKMISYRKKSFGFNNEKSFKKGKNSKNIFLNNSPSLEKSLLKAKDLCGSIDMEEYLKPDLDDMEYDDAIKLDKRTFMNFLVKN